MMQTKTVDARQLKSLLHDGTEFALLDVREAGQFGESHMLFATTCPYSRLELDIGALAPSKRASLVLTDEEGSGIAEQGASRLRVLGYTDVAVFKGGNRSWAEAGHTLFAGVNVPGKVFGELVEQFYHTPHITARELMHMKEAGEDHIIIDGRPVNEHRIMTVPDSICCPNAELPLRVTAMVEDPKMKIIVNCAGRTRSIIGAQTLINFGIPNPVYALENGTQGWFLAGFPLEYSSERTYPEMIDAASLPPLRAAARRLMERFTVDVVATQEAQAWLNDEERSTYLLDVRTPEEFKTGTITGAVHAPGGQLIQAADQWVGIRNARIVLIDGGENVRAPVVASWLKQLGFNAYVLEGGVKSGLKGIPSAKPALPVLSNIAAADLKRRLDAGAASVFDLGKSMNFRKAHIPGSQWSTRSHLVAASQGAKGTIVLLAEDEEIARLAAVDLLEADIGEVRLLTGGLAGWKSLGYATEASAGIPPDAECIDYLFFVHDRHAGNRESMRRYLAWETGLIGKLDEQDRAAFKLGPRTER